MSKLKRVEIMNRASFLRYGSKMILKFDLSNLDKVEDVNSIRRILRGAGQEHAQKIYGQSGRF